MEARLTPAAVQAIAEHPDGTGTIQPVLQVVDVRPVTTAKNNLSGSQNLNNLSERFRMMLSDGAYTQQSMLATALNFHVRDGTIRPGTIVHLQEFMCNTIQGRRIIIVVKLDILQSECAIIGSPKIYVAKSLSKEQGLNLPANAAQTNSGTYSISSSPGMLGSSIAPRAEQVANNLSYGGPHNGVQGTVGSSIDRTVEPGPNKVLSGGSYGTMSAQNTINTNMVQPKSQQPLLSSHQNQRFVVPATGGGFGPPGNTYGRPAQPLYQQPPPVYMNRGPVAKNEAPPRVVPISALNPYQGRWTIKARVTAKTDLRHYNNAKGAGKVFSFDLLDSHGGEIRATCFNSVLDQFYDLIEVDKVYLISRGSVKPAQKKFNPLNNDYELTLDSSTSIEICSGDDSSIPRQQYNFRQISEIENMDNEAMVDLVGVVTSVSPAGTIMRKNGMEAQKRTIQLKDMSGRSVEITLWGNFCDAEGQQLQSQCDSGLNPILALKNGRVSDFSGRSVSTISSSQLKINPDFPEAERLRQWYITEGKTVACLSLSREVSSMGRADVRKTIEQIKDENLGRSDKPDWITIKAAISHVQTDSFCYPACTLIYNEKQCNKKVTNNGDGTWHCDRCDKSSQTCEYRYLLTCQIQDHTGTTYATAFQEAGEQIVGCTAEKLFSIKNDDQDDAQFAEIMQGVHWHLYLLKLRIKEETFNDEQRVKCSIVKAEKLDPSKESCCLLVAIDSLLLDGLGSAPGVNSAVGLNAVFTNSEVGQSVLTSNNAYAMNTGGANQFGQQGSVCGGTSTPLSATRNVQTCSVCGSSGHNAQNCPRGSDMHQPPASGASMGSGLCFKCNQAGHWARDCPGQAAGSQQQTYGNGVASGGYSRQSFVGGLTSSNYGSSAGKTSPGLCFKCNQAGHWARDCPGQAAGPQQQTYGNGVASGGYSRQSFVGDY